MKKVKEYSKEDIINTLLNDYFYSIGINAIPATKIMQKASTLEETNYMNYIRGLLSELNIIESIEE